MAALPGQWPPSTATGITFRTGSNGGPNNGNVHYGHVWLSGIYSTMLKLNIYYILSSFVEKKLCKSVSPL